MKHEPAQAWDAALYDGRHAFVHAFGASPIDLLAPAAGEHILDLGCGTGHLTAKIADYRRLRVVAAKVSSERVPGRSRLWTKSLSCTGASAWVMPGADGPVPFESAAYNRRDGPASSDSRQPRSCL